MKSFKILTCAFILLFSNKINLCTENNWIYVDFDESMKKGFYNCCNKTYEETISQNYSQPNSILSYKITTREILDLAKDIYNKNNLSINKKRENKKIPKIIHQIWLGSPLPKRYKNIQETWIKNNPDWEYKLWTDENINEIDVRNKEIFKRPKSYGTKSDVLRIEILYKFGGIYIDTDFEYIKKFEILNDNYEFYCGFEPIWGPALLGSALIASVPGHPILKCYLDNLENNIKRYAHINDNTKVTSETGPYYFTDCVLETIKKYSDTKLCDNLILFPTTYFYPITRIGIVGNNLTNYLKKSPEAYGVHYFDASWW